MVTICLNFFSEEILQIVCLIYANKNMSDDLIYDFPEYLNKEC